MLVRGDHTLSEFKLSALLGEDARAATEEEIVSKFGASPGSLGPVGLTGIRILADGALRGRKNMICGANRDDYHLRYVTPGLHFEAEYHDLRATVPGPGDEGVPILSRGRLLGRAAPLTGRLELLRGAWVRRLAQA